MSTNRIPPVPSEVIFAVDHYADNELSDSRKYSNSSPLDESGIFSLHRLAADIYAIGFDAGARAEVERARAAAYRERARTKDDNTTGDSTE